MLIFQTFHNLEKSSSYLNSTRTISLFCYQFLHKLFAFKLSFICNLLCPIICAKTLYGVRKKNYSLLLALLKVEGRSFFGNNIFLFNIVHTILNTLLCMYKILISNNNMLALITINNNNI